MEQLQSGWFGTCFSRKKKTDKDSNDSRSHQTEIILIDGNSHRLLHIWVTASDLSSLQRCAIYGHFGNVTESSSESNCLKKNHFGCFTKRWNFLSLKMRMKIKKKLQKSRHLFSDYFSEKTFRPTQTNGQIYFKRSQAINHVYAVFLEVLWHIRVCFGLKAFGEIAWTVTEVAESS